MEAINRSVYPYTIDNGHGESLVSGPLARRTSGGISSTKAKGGRRPGLFDAAFLVTRYRNEFALLEAPSVVRRIVIPIVYSIGAVLGKYRKFKDAPAPVVIARAGEAS